MAKYAVKRAALKLAGGLAGLQKLRATPSPSASRTSAPSPAAAVAIMRDFGLSRISSANSPARVRFGRKKASGYIFVWQVTALEISSSASRMPEQSQDSRVRTGDKHVEQIAHS